MAMSRFQFVSLEWVAWAQMDDGDRRLPLERRGSACLICNESAAAETDRLLRAFLHDTARF